MDTKSRLVKWLKKKVKESNAKGLVMGISGGIDSSVVAVLAKKAVGSNFLALILPCHSMEEDILFAKKLAKKFKIKTELIDLTAVFDLFVKRLPKASKLAYANLKPRLRMITLYYFANKLNYLVVGTGNKSECMMGYFTKYGDGAVDILPIANLLKLQVKKLAKELKVPQDIIDRAPSAGLWAGQTDEGEMGITYNELDDILFRLENNKKQIAKREKIDKVKKTIRESCHKRQMPEIFRG